MKALVIGDIHGKEDWKDVDYMEYDRVIFVGDYLDSFTHSSAQLYSNLRGIIELKSFFPNKITLLLGNHDIQYFRFSWINATFRCSGYRPDLEYQFEVSKVFENNLSLFEIATLMAGW